ncbi:DUF4338 domain-containing protein, partial [Raoultella planticola]|nr:DUF4338 domain-containing protein [Raoultella planticola]
QPGPCSAAGGGRRGVRGRPAGHQTGPGGYGRCHPKRYRGFRTLVGQALRYVAEIDGQWVAMLGWQSAVRKCRPRDQWIGWPAVVQHQRLHLIANNAR